LGALLLGVVGFLSKPGDSSVKYKDFEFRGPIAFAVLGVGLLCVAAVQNHGDSPSVTPENLSAPAGATPRPRPLVAQTIAVPYYGNLEIGGSCQGTHRLADTWNCDATRTRRVHCQNSMVVIEPCPNACVQHQNGVDDECR
jgi:hypothetical protein